MALLDKLRQVTSKVPSGQSEQVARLYEYDSRYFVCSVRWIAEIGEPSVLAHDVGLQALGETISRHLVDFDPSEFNIRDRKLTDWPAFKASGAKSVRAFEANAWQCQLKRVGTTFEVWASPQLSLKEHLSAYSSANGALAEQIGQAVRNALSGAKAMRASGVV
jgi:hypothetical protein